MGASAAQTLARLEAAEQVRLGPGTAAGVVRWAPAGLKPAGVVRWAPVGLKPAGVVRWAPVGLKPAGVVRWAPAVLAPDHSGKGKVSLAHRLGGVTAPASSTAVASLPL